MSRRTALRLLGIGPRLAGGGGLTFLLRDDFTTAASAPLTSPRTAEPGPGTLTITDTNNKLSIVGGKLDFATGGVGNGNPGVWGALQARAAGLACISEVTLTTGTIYGSGFDVNQTSAPTDCIYLSGTQLGILTASTGVVMGAVVLGTSYALVTVMRGTGSLHFIKGGLFTNWTLLYPGNAGTDGRYPAITVGDTVTVATSDYLRVLDLPDPFSTDYGLATQRLAGARSAGDTFTHEANCVIEWTQTAVGSSGASYFWFRIQNSTNLWLIEVGANGNFSLYETVAGVNTVRGYALAVVSSGHRCVVVMDGSTIRGYSNNVLRWTYSSATNFATATNGRLDALSTGGAVSEIISWPRTLTGAAAAILDAAVA